MKMYQLFLPVVLFTMIFHQPLKGQLSEAEEERVAVLKPNIVLILADDLGYGDLGIYGSKQIKTPNIDKLAKTGARFTQGYVSSSVCSPSRAGLITGINQVSFGFDNNLAENQPGFDSQYLGLPVTQTTIASYLQELGYVNGLIGKWHLGDAPQFHPLKRGFDEFWGYTGGGHDYFQSKVDGKGYLSPVECNYKTPEPLTYITDDVGNEAVGFIQRHQKERFFLFTSFNSPHTPLQALEEDLNQYMHIGDEKRRTYAAMVHRLDINVGKIMTAIEEAGISEKTLIVFLSDNGGPTDTNASVNAPLNGQKGILLEGGIRVPFIMNWEGTIQKKTVYEKTVSSLDLAPTFFLLAGGKSKGKFPFDGVNLIPFLDKNNQEVPHQELYWRFTISAAIREGDWKLIRLPDRLPLLYNLSVDISEQDNVALDYPEKTAELLKKLGDWDVSLPHPVFLEGAEWKRRQLNLYDKEYLLDQPKK